MCMSIVVCLTERQLDKECYFNVQMARRFTKDLRRCSDDGAEANKKMRSS